jgi:hypothetical protein
MDRRAKPNRGLERRRQKKAGGFFNGYWYLDYNGNGVFESAATDRIYTFGQAGDTPVVGKWLGVVTMIPHDSSR